MTILIAYDFRSGNTETFARAVLEGVGTVEGARGVLRKQSDVEEAEIGRCGWHSRRLSGPLPLSFSSPENKRFGANSIESRCELMADGRSTRLRHWLRRASRSFMRRLAAGSIAACYNLARTMVSIREYVDFATNAAFLAGQLTLAHFQTGASVDRKPDASPVTVADRGSEELLRRLIEKRVPDHGLFGEEMGESSKSTNRALLEPLMELLS